MPMTTDSIPAGNSQPTPLTLADSGRVPVATTFVLFAIVLGLLAFIAIA